jgi:hypothetical protein
MLTNAFNTEACETEWTILGNLGYLVIQFIYVDSLLCVQPIGNPDEQYKKRQDKDRESDPPRRVLSISAKKSERYARQDEHTDNQSVGEREGVPKCGEYLT